MRQENKIFAALLAILLPLASWALPFVPTTDPSSSETYWYQLRYGSYYAYALIEPYHSEIAASATESSDDTFLWCFVGDETTGYRVYNRATKKFLVGNVFESFEDDVFTYYEAGSGNNFYLTYQNPMTGFYDKYYLVYDSGEQQFYLEAYKGNSSYTVIEKIGGTPTLENQRYDINGVGYAYLDGGSSSIPNETAYKMHDHNAETKFLAYRYNFTITVKASEPVALKQYSLVTADDTRSEYRRSPENWKVSGSNDLNQWEVIDFRYNWPIPFANQEEVVLPVHDTREFTYFKFEPIVRWGEAYFDTQLSEFWINEESHNWQQHTVMGATCGKGGYVVWKCADCNVLRTTPTSPTGEHNYAAGSDICSQCGTKKGVVKLLENGQDVPYQVRAFKGLRNSDETWPAQPIGWVNETYDDSDWFLLTMPTASPGHTDGPFNGMKYNSLWHGEYNNYLMRRKFELPNYNPNAEFTFRCVHDDNMRVYVNGYPVITAEGWTNSPENPTFENSAESFKISSEVFHQGTNVVCVDIQQNWGGAYFDFELLMENPTGNVAGDVDNDGKVDVADINALINLLLGQPQNAPYPDVNNDSKVDIGDINAVINIMLQTN